MSEKRVCFGWRENNCKRGNKCKYAHDEFSVEACRAFQRNQSCKWGKSCKHGHWIGRPQANTARPSQSQGHGRQASSSSTTQTTDRVSAPAIQPTQIQSWRKICRVRVTFSPIQMQGFLEGALKLIKTNDVDSVQQVIKELAEEQNLAHIKQLLEANLDYDGAMGNLSFVVHGIPFLKIITDTEFQNSIVMEKYAGTIYNVLYGNQGTRGIAFSERILSLSRSLMANDPDQYLEVFPMIISALRHTIQLNSNAIVQDGVKRIARLALTQANEQSLLTNPEMRHLHQNFKVINEQLALGQQIPPLIPQATQTAGPSSLFTSLANWFAGGSKGVAHPNLHPALQATTRLPGDLSDLGPRHDNDHASIADIHILPTAEEIRSIESEYLPKVGAVTIHLDRNQRLLDSQFRLLREDSIGCLRESLRQIIENRGNLDVLRSRKRKDNGVRRLFSAGVALLVHQNIRVEDLYFSSTQGLKVGISFDQPNPALTTKNELRNWWSSENVLEYNSLVCILNEANDAVFFTVADRFITMRDLKDRERDEFNRSANQQAILTLSENPSRAGIVLSFANTVREADIRWLYNLAYSRDPSRIYLIEFPKTLLASFRPILQGLQKRINQTQAIPFIDWLAPDPSLNYQQCTDNNAKVQVQTPPYASKQGFFFDLKSIFTDPPDQPVRLYPNLDNFDIQLLLDNTTLDDGQARSLVKALSREIGLIQGPPGTGKSFVGTKIVKVLLANKHRGDLGPIICVCYTNHALDQFLEHLLDTGVTNIIRLGSRSKSERLEPYLLKTVGRSSENTKLEGKEIWDLKKTTRAFRDEAEEYCEILGNLNSEATFRTHIQGNYPTFFNSLFSVVKDEEGFEVNHGHKKKPFAAWRSKAYSGSIGQSVRSILNTTSNPWNLDGAEINAILTYWQQEIFQETVVGLADVTEKHRKENEKLSTLKKERDRRLLQRADIIGVTTSSLAGHADVLERIRAKVLFCEEAGEILEAHTITALIPSIEHMILIGDHEQLRPHVANYDLSIESRKGQAYALDMSLFERLVNQPYGNLALTFPIASLNTQRRMHSTIADLIRIKTYPSLRDQVSDYPPIPGMKKRLFWMTHGHADSKGDALKATTSFTNKFEQDMVISLVTHLLHQGVFKEKQIAVLTPYLGQMSKLRQRLGNTFDIVIGSRDQEDLDAAYIEEDEESSTGGDEIKPGELDLKSVVRKSSLAAAVRIATIDNFQGEEADVVIISLVRSNQEHQCGFLKTSNRINVLLSRAKWGMYIIGDANTAGSVPMWSSVISHLNINNCLGDSLELQCDRHKDIPIHVSSPEHFIELAPEGGCSRRCEWRLSCGHACISKCHSAALHKITVCYEPCPKELKGCSHPCASKCGQPCAACLFPIRDVPLKCGHVAPEVKCWQYQKLDDYFCRARLEKTVPGCNHKLVIECGRDINSAKFQCPAICGAILDCGHNCKEQCKDCRKLSSDAIIETKHAKCRQKCDRPFNTCSHSCEKDCHDGMPCSFCEKPCEISCVHSKCSKKCREPCPPCAEQCPLGCEHQRCVMPCGVSCSILPCDKLCSKVLECGHPCPSICGEKCPKKEFCRECASPEILDTVVDMLMFETYRDSTDEPMVFLECGHFYTVSTFDGIAKMKDFFEFSSDEDWTITKRYVEEKNPPQLPRCPNCRRTSTNSARYNEVVKKAQLQNCIRQFTSASNTRLMNLIQRVDSVQKELENSRDKFTVAEDKAFKSRYKKLREARKDLQKFNAEVLMEEQPYHRVFELATAAYRKYGITPAEYNLSVIQYRFGIEGAYQELRLGLSEICDKDIISSKKTTPEEICKTLKSQIASNANKMALACNKLALECNARKQQLIEIRARVSTAKFVMLVIKHKDYLKAGTALFLDADSADVRKVLVEDLEGCLKICDKVPSCKNLKGDVEETIKSLKGDIVFYSVVSDKEMAQIWHAMAREFGAGGTGHWYVCPNGHQFTIGECGQAYSVGRCNECGAQVGGHGHRALAGVRRDTAIDDRMQRLRLQN